MSENNTCCPIKKLTDTIMNNFACFGCLDIDEKYLRSSYQTVTQNQ